MAMIVDREKCIGCESCMAVCPVGAIAMVEGKAKIDPDVCISCGACVSECPVEAISSEVAVEKKAAVGGDGHDIWVIAEVQDNQCLDVTYELLAEGAVLASKVNEKCCAVLIAGSAGDVPANLIARGADKVYVVEGAEYEEYNTDLYTDAVSRLVEKYAPSAIMFGATADGRDLAPRVAARLHTGLCADCTALDIREDGIVEWTRPALGGNIYATILCEEHRPQMGTVRPGVFKAPVADASRQGEIISFTIADPVNSPVRTVSRTAAVLGNKIKLEDADVICAGGRGFGTLENFKVLEELAELFENSAVAGTRAVTDDGWIAHQLQVGQSGKTVKPHLYFACGISGAVQHISGMKESDIIVSVNRDAHAPIFNVSTYGVVGDVNVILPKLIAKIKAYKEN